MSKNKKKVTSKVKPSSKQSKIAGKSPIRRILLITSIVMVVAVLGYLVYCNMNNSNILSTSNTTSANTPSIPVTGEKIMSWDSAPAMTIDQNKQYTAIINTDFGEIKCELYPKDAPITTNNFVFLARQRFYDGLTFHRVEEGFVIQGGDPNGNGTGGPGYKFQDEKITRDYVEGTLAMANAGSNTNGSQFFIALTDLTPALPKNYTIFGKVSSGMDVVKKIEQVPVKGSAPVNKVTINKITIEEK